MNVGSAKLILMDNDINIVAPPPRQGPPYTDLYRLHVARIPLHSEAVSSFEQYTYFSLKDALCTMLLSDVFALDPVIAAATGAAHTREPHLFAGKQEIASLVAIRPERQTFHHVAVPGIYLSSPLGIATLARITGIAMPRPEGNDEDDMLLLAEYNSDFTRLSVLKTFGQIVRQAAVYLNCNERLTNGMHYQLVYKGVHLNASSAESKDRRIHYVEQHYYNNVHEPVRDLLRTDLFLFDPYSERPPGTPAKDHHFGYILSANHPEVLASINVMDISDCPEGTPTAGIYLHVEPDIAALEEATGIDFSVASSYDPQVPMLLLARFKYDNGYQLQPDPGISVLNSQLALAQYTVERAPRSSYVTRTHYEVAGADKGQQPGLRTATDFYHYADLSSAILKLLHTDLVLLNAANMGAIPSTRIVQADVRDSVNQTWAHLRLQPAGPRQAPTVSLALDMGLTHMAVQTGVMMDLARLELLPHPPSIDGEQVVIPIAEFGPDGLLHTLTPNVDVLTSLLEGQQACRHLPIADRIAAYMQVPPGQERAGYLVELDWASEPESGDFRVIPFARLEEAHRFLLAIDPSLFNHAWPPSTYIETARLVETSTNTLLAERFRLGEAAEIVPPGFYLLYNPNEEGVALASSITGYERISTPGEPLAWFRLTESPPPPSRLQMLRPRILPPYDPSRRLGK